MCGRFENSEPQKIKQRFNVAIQPELMAQPNYNISPSQNVYTLSGNPVSAVWRKWGFIPHFVKDPKKSPKPINARVETLFHSGFYRHTTQSQRCGIPANGFYEWLKADGNKIPHHIGLKNHDLFLMGGIYDTWKDAEGYPLETFAIITLPANSLVGHLHDRMPLIISKKHELAWLDPNTSLPEIKSMVTAYPSNLMEMTRVSDRVNSPKNNDPELLHSVSPHQLHQTK